MLGPNTSGYFMPHRGLYTSFVSNPDVVGPGNVAVVAQSGRVERVPAFKVKPVDTTAAGDAFTAALTVEYVKGTDLLEAARVANAAGALACTRLGAQPSMPTADEVAAFLDTNA